MTNITAQQARDPRTLAATLQELALPGQRSATAITRLRRQRAHRTAQIPTPPLQQRLTRHITDRYTAEVVRRGGEIAIEQGSKSSDLQAQPLTIADRSGGLVLLHVEGYRYYSRGYGSSFTQITYLCGRDDSGDWAVRVPGTLSTVTGALVWLTPAAVSSAQAAGRRVDRQGDVYAVATTKAHDAPSGWVDEPRPGPDGELVSSHYWDAVTRTLSHHPADGRPHAPLALPHPVRFVQQRAFGMGRGGRWGAGD